jgi:hypothetical protein
MGPTACTKPQCLYMCALYLTVELYLYSPYGPYGLYKSSVPVQGCTLHFTASELRHVRQNSCLTDGGTVRHIWIPKTSMDLHSSETTEIQSTLNVIKLTNGMDIAHRLPLWKQFFLPLDWVRLLAMKCYIYAHRHKLTRASPCQVIRQNYSSFTDTRWQLDFKTLLGFLDQLKYVQLWRVRFERFCTIYTGTDKEYFTWLLLLIMDCFCAVVNDS